MRPMIPTLHLDPPGNGDWLFEVKYDGFRGILNIQSKDSISLKSRNGNELLPFFPEIKEQILTMINDHKVQLPIKLDGEIVLLRSPNSCEFFELQRRGRMKNQKRIEEASKIRPVKFLVFDLLHSEKKIWADEPYMKRKEELQKFFTAFDLPLEPTPNHPSCLQMIPNHKDWNKVWGYVVNEEGEGVVAKARKSKWEGKRSTSWIKIKNWKRCLCFITAFDSNNDYFHIGVYQDQQVVSIGLFHFGISPKEKKILKEIILKNTINQEGSLHIVNPGICVEVFYLNFHDGQIREPHFHQFMLSSLPEECTLEQFLLDEASLPVNVELTSLDKELWKKPFIQKLDYIRFLRKMSVVILPFLKNRPLTCIRYPHGIFGDSFFQKNRPEYAPSFIQTVPLDQINYILCNDLSSLIWLGNQLALEFHIPYQKWNQVDVNEIVFDLDPPNRDSFPLAIKAARVMKEVFDSLDLHSFIKTSGNKGLQIYLPLPSGYSWEDTSLFTEFIADYLVSNFPEHFTIERLKKNRHGRLYVDYIQHAEGKTIIAPYSLRGNDHALVATPLWWSEVTEDLNPENFTMDVVLKRFQKFGCPFSQYDRVKEIQPFKEVIQFLKKHPEAH
ncbi:DNA ligase D [Rossellomorea aquimaris]|uniref:DNA ligase D n=1 Tax=Rossellomorea aquimaris TaxID=189382 RepID=UPI0007D04479|nr:DNA ligase D [Rossellomorea aquimaris]